MEIKLKSKKDEQQVEATVWLLSGKRRQIFRTRVCYSSFSSKKMELRRLAYRELFRLRIPEMFKTIEHQIDSGCILTGSRGISDKHKLAKKWRIE
mgnify:CR=1 FL=1